MPEAAIVATARTPISALDRYPPAQSPLNDVRRVAGGMGSAGLFEIPT